tara:strand:- start:13959 stop:15125 length:1167 start_codon:yes stop_codon:yes gene_type:complete
MASPAWVTKAGILSSTTEGTNFSLQLDVSGETSSTELLTYSVISGNLPAGLRLTKTGLIKGIVGPVRERTESKFVVRVSDGTNVADRTFRMIVTGVTDAPVWTTPSGRIITTIDGTFVSKKLVATDPDFDPITYNLRSGKLPAGLELDGKTGVLSGYLQSLQSTDSSLTLFEEYAFEVVATDGVNETGRTFKVMLISADSFRADNALITADGQYTSIYDSTLTGTFYSSALDSTSGVDSTNTGTNIAQVTADGNSQRDPVFTTDADLGEYKFDNYYIQKIDVFDPDALRIGSQQVNTLSYSITAGALPSGIVLDPLNGELYGELPVVSQDTVFTFTITASRLGFEPTYTGEDSTVISTVNSVSKTFTLKIKGPKTSQISWDIPAEVHL